MAELSNAKWEMFCRYRSQGKTLVDSYELAGFVRSTAGGSTLSKNPVIQARIEELITERTSAMDRMDPGKMAPHTAEAVRKGEFTIDKEWVLAELIENVELARGAGQLAAANKALELVGVELGMFGKGKTSEEENKTQQPMMIPISELTRTLDLLQGTMPPGTLITKEDLTPHITGITPKGRPRTTHVGQGTQPKEIKARAAAKRALAKMDGNDAEVNYIPEEKDAFS